MKASSTFRYAFTDIWNLVFLAMFGFGLFVSARALFVLGQNNLLMFLFFLLFFFCFVFQIWGMLTITIEVHEVGLKYKAASRKVIVEWEDIELIHFESFKRQITFWIRGKKVRIHEFGLNPNEYVPVKNYMHKKIVEHQIPMK